MAILKVARMGHPVLRKVAQEVELKEIKTREFQQFCDDMVETMREYNGVGLAAPQVHRSIRVAVIEFDDENPRYKDKGHSGLQVYINPVVTPLTKDTSANWEGCLSVPGMRALVKRPNKINVKYLDREGKPHEFVAEGFLAVVIQHEFDHLDGTLYIDRAEPKSLTFDEEFDRYIAPEAEEDVLDD